MMQFVEDRLWHDFRYSFHCQKIHILGWRLQRTIDWYSKNDWWWRGLVN